MTETSGLSSDFTTKDYEQLKKILDDHLVRTKLPPMHGVSARVVNALTSRIGHSSMAVSEIASDLNLSIRTLQRRLLHEGTNFSEIREQFRRHHALRMLLLEDQGVDFVFSALDYSDRTSLTKAFKRWTGLAPAVFKRVFRDYL